MPERGFTLLEIMLVIFLIGLASAGVVQTFAVNPIVGAAVFAASKVLGPLWSKVSILRYHISGPLDDPQINEVLRQPRKEKAQ